MMYLKKSILFSICYCNWKIVSQRQKEVSFFDLDHAFQVLEISFWFGDLPHQQYSIDCLTSASTLFVHVHLCTAGHASLRCKI